MIENVEEFFELKSSTETKISTYLESVGLDKSFTNKLIQECESEFKDHLEGKNISTRNKMFSANDAWNHIVTNKLYKLGKKIKSLVTKAELQMHYRGTQVWDSKTKGIKRGKN
jgi:hypothetical protein